ncbi:MAG: ferritin-like domain-containing protein [Bacteroidota bacterium]
MPTSSDSLLGLLDEDHLQALSDAVVDRRRALAQAGRLGAKALVASVPLALASVARPVFGQAMPPTVTEVLNFALVLERLEAEFYRLANAAGVVPSTREAAFEAIAAHEAAHVRFLEGVLGSDADPAPTFDFTAEGRFDPFNPNDPRVNPTYLVLAQVFEDTGVRAYKGQVANLFGTDVLGAALQIHSVEARHAAFIRTLLGSEAWIAGNTNTTEIPDFDPVYAREQNVRQDVRSLQLRLDVPDLTSVSRSAVEAAFDEPLTMDEVQAILAPFIVS